MILTIEKLLAPRAGRIEFQTHDGNVIVTEHERVEAPSIPEAEAEIRRRQSSREPA